MIEVYDLIEIQKIPHLRESMHNLRYRMFCERQKWDVSNIGGYEIDQYDRLEIKPVYLIARGQGNTVAGTCRLLTTTGSYSLSKLKTKVASSLLAQVLPLNAYQATHHS